MEKCVTNHHIRVKRSEILFSAPVIFETSWSWPIRIMIAENQYISSIVISGCCAVILASSGEATCWWKYRFLNNITKICWKGRKNIVNGEDSGEILGTADCLIPFGSPVKSWILAESLSLLWLNSISISSSSEEGGGGEEAFQLPLNQLVQFLQFFVWFIFHQNIHNFWWFHLFGISYLLSRFHF